MKTQKENVILRKILLIVLIIAFFFAVFLHPLYNKYQNNRMLRDNKKKILQASQFEISEEKYLQELNDLQMELDVYQKLIPEKETQQLLYDGLKEAIDESQVKLIELHFGRAFVVDAAELKKLVVKEKNHQESEFNSKELYAMPIKIRTEGDQAAINNLFALLENTSPLVTIHSFNFEKMEKKKRIDLELVTYFFQEKRQEANILGKKTRELG